MNRQGGMILLFCLVFLALISLMAVSGLESILLHERAAENLRRSSGAFEAAGAALLEAESRLGEQCPDVGGAFAADLPRTDSIWTRPDPSGADWWRRHGHDAAFPDAGEPPRFAVESWRGETRPRDSTNPQRRLLSVPVYYRITARGSGAGTAVLQSVGVVVCADSNAISQSRLSWRQLF